MSAIEMLVIISWEAEILPSSLKCRGSFIITTRIQLCTHFPNTCMIDFKVLIIAVLICDGVTLLVIVSIPISLCAFLEYLIACCKQPFMVIRFYRLTIPDACN